MSLTVDLSPPPVANLYGNRKKYIVNAAMLVQGGAFTTMDIVLDTFPAGAIMLMNTIKHTTPVAGTSFSASTARLFWEVDGSLTALGAGALDVFAAVGTTDGTHSITGVTPLNGNVDGTSKLVMRVTTTGGNLAATTAGVIIAVVDVEQL